jgi:hypothetical protein
VSRRPSCSRRCFVRVPSPDEPDRSFVGVDGLSKIVHIPEHNCISYLKCKAPMAQRFVCLAILLRRGLDTRSSQFGQFGQTRLALWRFWYIGLVQTYQKVVNFLTRSQNHHADSTATLPASYVER